MKTVIVIPARMESQRLPGKPLLEIEGKPLLEHTYLRARQTIADHVVIATPDPQIATYCGPRIPWMKTSFDCPTGTHRVAELAAKLRPELDCDLIVNLQVDEWQIDPADISDLIKFHLEDMFPFDVTTIVSGCCFWGDVDDKDITKAAIGKTNRIHWFSRAPMKGSLFHCGIYAYKKSILDELGKLEPTYSSEQESLEQLTWIENGYTIGGWVVDHLPHSINSEVDYEYAIN